MIAVVIVTYSALPAMLDDCIASVRAAGGADHIIVVDNGGKAFVGADIELVRPERNLGFGGGANAGFRRAVELGADEIALLNDDVTVVDGWLAPLSAALAGESALGAAQPKLLMAGTDPAEINSVGVVIGRDGSGRDVGFGEPDGSGFADDRAIESFTGGAVLFRTQFLADTGGFDDSYFLYYEDVDLARRGTAAGWAYRCVPASTVWHQVSASTAQVGDRARYLQERNRLRFAWRFGDGGHIVRALWLSIRRLRHAPRGVHARALLSGLAAAPKALRARRRARHNPPPTG